MSKQRWQDWLLLIGGIWLFVAPWALGTSTDAASSWNAWIVGVLVVASGWWALARPDVRAAEWLQALFGVWLFITPWVLGFTAVSAAAWNAWIVGGAVLVLGLWALAEVPSTSPAKVESEHPVSH